MFRFLSELQVFLWNRWFFPNYRLGLDTQLGQIEGRLFIWSLGPKRKNPTVTYDTSNIFTSLNRDPRPTIQAKLSNCHCSQTLCQKFLERCPPNRYISRTHTKALKCPLSLNLLVKSLVTHIFTLSWHIQTHYHKSRGMNGLETCSQQTPNK